MGAHSLKAGLTFEPGTATKEGGPCEASTNPVWHQGSVEGAACARLLDVWAVTNGAVNYSRSVGLLDEPWLVIDHVLTSGESLFLL